MNVLAIDPGSEFSGFCLVESGTLKPLLFDKMNNRLVLDMILENPDLTYPIHEIVIEQVDSYGMPVGKEVFKTCEWIGRFVQCAEYRGIPYYYLYRREEKLHICKDSKAKDANIRRALIDRFASHDFANGKGTKKDPDFFYGFRSDIWSAYAIAITHIEKKDRPP